MMHVSSVLKGALRRAPRHNVHILRLFMERRGADDEALLRHVPSSRHGLLRLETKRLLRIFFHDLTSSFNSSVPRPFSLLPSIPFRHSSAPFCGNSVTGAKEDFLSSLLSSFRITTDDLLQAAQIEERGMLDRKERSPDTWKQVAINEAAMAVVGVNFPDIGNIEFVWLSEVPSGRRLSGNGILLGTKLGIQTEKQQQLLMKYVEGKGKETLMNSVAGEGSSNRNIVNDSTIDGVETMMKEVKNEGQTSKAEGDEHLSDCNKFEKVDMPVFSGSDSDSWLFQADCYFQIHKPSDLEKLTVVVISFDRAALDWYQSQKEREPFVNWSNLKQRLLVRFRSKKPEVECWEPKGLAEMMKLAQRVENRGVTRREAGLKMNCRGKSPSTLPYNKVTNPSNLSENKSGGMVPMRTITLRGATAIEN
ncbi:transposon Tf2-1 polyprotein isoform X1 [Cucumis melo var. makuwa]|uniref:Transposon Tf2-1 polyprotein isoform X1 n=1 Tax=Cucumis melo var. makuwa TaxID=1194695 RepID=A0A5A7UA02_CUCMM|nr:transposon Tf2-1 polyprotein isoform X1 [Cucumis melo var. makuwa]TYK03813.1 transposon Tf2-1 polyprotein isoform X1 [Cucumis melo var. makuwa]